MKHPPFQVFWNVLLVLACWGLQSDGEMQHSGLCLSGNMSYMEERKETCCYQRNASGGAMQLIPDEDCLHSYSDDFEDEPYPCRLYPTNILNCTFKPKTPFPKSSQASASISTSDGKTGNWILKENKTLETGVTAKSACFSLTVEDNMSYVILRINNMSLPNASIIYYVKLDIEAIEVPPPPANINVSMINGRLVVRWGLPVLRVPVPMGSDCFKYQLYINGDLYNKTEKNQFTEKIEALSYNVKLRTKKDMCPGPDHWSEWSDTITLDLSKPTQIPDAMSEFNWVILSISLGIPMILLCVLLLFRPHRVFSVIFPRVPQPPVKYKAFLENDVHDVQFPPAVQPPDSVERISEVEETEATL